MSNQPDNSLDLFKEGTMIFQDAAAELPPYGNGIAANNAEEYAEEAAELAFGTDEFTPIAENLILGAEEINESAAELVPLQQAEQNTLIDYTTAIFRGSLLLQNGDPQNSPREAGYEDISAGATALLESAKIGESASAEFVDGAEQLLAGAEKYSSGAFEYTAAEEFIGADLTADNVITGAFEVTQGAEAFASAEDGSANLLSGAEQIADGAERYYNGAALFVDGVDVFGTGAEENPAFGAENMVPSAESLLSDAAEMLDAAENPQQKTAASEMIADAELLVSSAENINAGEAAEQPAAVLSASETFMTAGADYFEDAQAYVTAEPAGY